MYTVKETTDRDFRIIELSDADGKTWVKVCPERGGIIIGFGVNGKELLYLNKETFYDRNKNIRGGIPILFPISGQLTDGKYEWKGQTYHMPNHGFARIKPWEVVRTDQTTNQASITLRLKSDNTTKESFPFEFEVLYTYILKHNELIIEQTYQNLSSESMPIYAGFHPYFQSKTKELTIQTNATEYFDYNDNKVKDFTGSFNLNGMKESVALLEATKEITAPLSDSNITMKYDQPFRYMVLWVEGEQDFVCLEPWMAKTNELNVKEELTIIEPGEPLKTVVSITGE